MSVKHERIDDDSLFYCFVVLRGTHELPHFFIVPSAYVAAYVREQHAYWVRKKHPAGADTSIRRFRIPVSDPLGFEDNWELLAGEPIPDCQRVLNEAWVGSDQS
jgi:hypothetical protein